MFWLEEILPIYQTKIEVQQGWAHKTWERVWQFSPKTIFVLCVRVVSCARTSLFPRKWYFRENLSVELWSFPAIRQIFVFMQKKVVRALISRDYPVYITLTDDIDSGNWLAFSVVCVWRHRLYKITLFFFHSQLVLLIFFLFRSIRIFPVSHVGELKKSKKRPKNEKGESGRLRTFPFSLNFLFFNFKNENSYCWGLLSYLSLCQQSRRTNSSDANLIPLSFARDCCG